MGAQPHELYTTRSNGEFMPEQRTRERARKARREGKSAATQASEFVREEIHHVREGKHGARSTRQAIAIGLSKARRAGVRLPPPKKDHVSAATRHHAERDYARGQSGLSRRSSARRSHATVRALKREGHAAATRSALSRHARRTAHRRTVEEKSTAARRAARTRLGR